MNNFYYKEGITFINDEDTAISNDIQKLVVDTLVRNSAVGVVSGFYEEGYPIYFISQFALASVGYDSYALKNEMGGKYIECVCPTDRAYYSRFMEWKGDAPKEIEYRVKNSKGEYIWVRDVRADYEAEDGRRLWISSIRVIQNEHMARKEFISTISHDIRSPLNSIMGMAQLAGKNINSKEKVQSYIDGIITSAEKFMYQISEVLDMNELETTVARLEEKEYNICSLADSVIKGCSAAVKARGQQIVTDYSGITDKNVICDGRNISKVLDGLISNASEYSPKGSCVTIKVVQKDNSTYEFNVIDEGEGIPYYEVDRLFEPFERIQDARSAADGTHMGLGLSVIKSIVELMNGTISVKSSTGKGSCFTVRLMLKAAVSDECVTDKQPAMVLIVEDNQKNAEIM